MSNYEKFKQIINPKLRTVRRERSVEEGSCFSSIFSSCCGSSESSPEPSIQNKLKADQRNFLVGIDNVAEKIMRGDMVFPQDFAGNIPSFERPNIGEDAPLLRTQDARRTASTQNNIAGKPYMDFLPPFNQKDREGVFNVYLNAVYHYLHSLENEGEFSHDLMTEFERSFGGFIAQDIEQGLELQIKNFVIKSIKNAIPMKTRNDDINDVKAALLQASGVTASPVRQPAMPAAATLTTPPTVSDDLGGAGSYGQSYTGTAVPARPAKK